MPELEEVTLDGDGNLAMIGNTDKSPELSKVPHDPSKPSALTEKEKEGKVKRTFTCMDRNMIFAACQETVDRAALEAREKKEKSGQDHYKKNFKFEKVKKLLETDQTIEYYIDLDEAIKIRLLEWQGAKNRHLSWLRWKAGIKTRKEVLEQFEDFDFENKPEAPAPKMPEATDDERIGPPGESPREFWIDRKLDTWIEECLKGHEFPSGSSLFVTELYSKYGLKED